jgi:hypothetical protein
MAGIVDYKTPWLEDGIAYPISIVLDIFKSTD